MINLLSMMFGWQTDNKWRPRQPLFGRLQMRKRGPDGKWVYRDLTPAEGIHLLAKYGRY